MPSRRLALPNGRRQFGLGDLGNLSVFLITNYRRGDAMQNRAYILGSVGPAQMDGQQLSSTQYVLAHALLTQSN